MHIDPAVLFVIFSGYSGAYGLLREDIAHIATFFKRQGRMRFRLGPANGNRVPASPAMMKQPLFRAIAATQQQNLHAILPDFNKRHTAWRFWRVSCSMR